MTSIQIDDVRVTFTSKNEHVIALDGVTLSVAAGTVATVFGASGSGKSTLLNVAAGLLPVDSGHVLVAGEILSQAGEASRARIRLEHIGVIFQENNLVPEFTALENITLPMRVRGVSAVSARAQAAGWLERVGMAGLGGRRPGELSGGQRQRVGIARALAGNRRVLIADEPTGALDSENSEQIFALLRVLANDGCAVLVASHDGRSKHIADEVYEKLDGRVAQHRARSVR